MAQAKNAKLTYANIRNYAGIIVAPDTNTVRGVSGLVSGYVYRDVWMREHFVISEGNCGSTRKYL